MTQPFSVSLIHPRYWATWLGTGLLALVHWLPLSLQRRLANFSGGLLYRFSDRQKRIARINIELCYPEWDSAKRDAFLRSYFNQYCLVIFQSPLIWWSSDRRFLNRTLLQGTENIDVHQKAGRGVILLYSHCMPLDFGAIALSSTYSMYGVYNPFKNPVVDWIHNRGRSRFGGVMVARGNSFRSFIKAVSAGDLVVYLCDEDFGPKGSVFAPFFGKNKCSLTMLSRIALKTGAAVVPVYTRLDSTTGLFITDIEPALDGYPGTDDVANAAQVNAATEKLVRQHPEQYLWKLKFFNTPENGTVSVYQQT